ncbi:16S rRNA (cytidine(1402)-2'-O)-methyltransferase [Candidatus Binatia bacterium]|nr:16S rRNA (cytidine(1402)-2'-O)-methyltransferase [Candidatus Binatia bacterium]
MSGTLFIVATPLGNLGDISLRALEVLKTVDLIAAEDTRHSRALLVHYGVATPLTSYHDHSEREKAPRLVAELQRGKRIALISDAGTPGIADPGFRLVRAAVAAGISVVPVPGPSAVVTALSVAGLPTDRFAFDGFVPARAGARRRFYERLGGETRTVVVYETARRLADSLADARAVLGERAVAVCRELTKRFEEVVRGPLGVVLEQVRLRPVETMRGEVVLVIAGAEPRAAETPEESLPAAIVRLRGEGLSLKEVARRLARERKMTSREIYKVGLAVGSAPEDD